MSSSDKKIKVNEVSATMLSKLLNEHYFSDILEKIIKKDYKIINMEMNLATKNCENFLSMVFRATLDIQIADNKKNMNLSFIVKVEPDVGITNEYFTKAKAFPKEIEIYSKIIPEFEALLHGVGDDITFSPKYFKSTTGDQTTIVLEDLSKLQYRTADRQKGLDLAHTKLVLKKLAKFHAASMMLYDKNGPYNSSFEMQLISKENSQMFADVCYNNNKIFLTVLEGWSTGKNYVKMLNSEMSRMFEEPNKICMPNSNNLNVLNHNDMWTNNLMFCYDEETGLVKDVLLIDFQMCLWASPAIDLNCFIMTSLNEEIKLDKFDYVIQFYHYHLSDTLKKLNYQQNIPTLREIQIEMLDKGYYALLSTIQRLPIFLMDLDTEANIENFINNDERAIAFRTRLYKNPRYMRQMELLLPYFKRKGILINEEFDGN